MRVEGDGGAARRAVPPLDLRFTSQHLDHVTGPATVRAEQPDELVVRLDDATVPTGDELTALGARDVLVLRRISATRWTHLGGRGRGETWAGVVEVDSVTDERLARALRSDRPVRQHGVDPHHVLGPYWAITSVLVRLDDDHAVVLGAPRGSQRLYDAADGVVRTVAHEAATAVADSTPTRHLADEVEVMSAVRDFACHAPTGMDELMSHVVASVAQALSCELAALWMAPGRFAVVQRGWSLPGTADQLGVVLASLAGEDGAAVVVQDAVELPLAHPVGPAAGIVSYLVHPVRVEGRAGVLLAAHAAPSARGFTSLCQRLLEGLAESATLLLGNAVVREDLERALQASHQQSRRDPLTAIVNRRGWDEALERLRPDVASGVPVTVVAVDLDGLKQVNDSIGHAGGDELIVSCARALQQVVRERDVVSRLGGDEFGLLMPGVQTAPILIARRLRRSLDAVVTSSGVRLRTSIGAATCPPYGRIEDAWAEADAAMYDDKRARRRAR